MGETKVGRPSNVESFLRAIGEVGLLDVLEPERREPERLPDLFVKCPMCAGTTDVNFYTRPFYSFCNLCGQRWDLRGEPLADGCGDKEVWRKRRKYVEVGNNGNGHKYGCDLDGINLEFTNAKRV
jgi:hypothetical protein